MIFPTSVYLQTANWASEQNKTEMLFYSEWITLIPREKMQGFQDTIKRFENVAVIGRTEVKWLLFCFWFNNFFFNYQTTMLKL